MLGHFNYWLAIVIIMIGFYGVIARRNLLKQAIALGLFQTGVFLFYVTMGVYRTPEGVSGVAPIWTDAAKAGPFDNKSTGFYCPANFRDGKGGPGVVGTAAGGRWSSTPAATAAIGRCVDEQKARNGGRVQAAAKERSATGRSDGEVAKRRFCVGRHACSHPRWH